jgi:hypothetical protein
MTKITETVKIVRRKSPNLDDALLAREYGLELLEVARDIANAVSFVDDKRGRAKERAMTGLYLRAKHLREVLTTLNLR